ncbi:MAG: sigma-54 dependent transcriptional regulator [Terracidiphilus sp.]|nr:sigma-54 dependent transcriptional regulator [Terracidiphilus sp.]
MIRIGLYSKDRTLHPLLASALGAEFHLHQESDEEGIRDLVMAEGCDVLILDLYSHGDGLEKGIESSRRLVSLGVPAVIMADEYLYAKFSEFINQEAFGYCRRPPSIRELKSLLRRAYETLTLKQQLESAEERLDEVTGCDRLIGTSPLMQHVYRRVRNVANLNAVVLITGESGTGKELIARAIHNLSPRSNRPFTAVSCGAIPETLIESELFGHTNGAFTGTGGPHEGYLEKAGEGTLFFDEIGELSPSTQVKLLRVLQEMEFNRLGSTRVIPLRARLVFATNQDLPKMVAEGRFRQDLYYRINVVRIQAPSLRSHSDDLPLLANGLLHRYSMLFGKAVDRIEPKAMDMLSDYPWPGNVRELESVIQRAIIDTPGHAIRPEDLTLLPEEEDSLEDSTAVKNNDPPPSGSFERRLWEYKIKLALAAVRENNGNKALAARSLGMSRAYLYRLLSLAESEMFELQEPIDKSS